MSKPKRGISTERVYQVLCANLSKSLSQRDICEKAKASQATVSRVLTILEREGNLLVNRNAVPVKYKLIKLIAGVEVSHSLHGIQGVVSTSLSSNEINGFLETWAKTTWEPKVNKSLRNLPHSVAGLYGLAIEAMYGAEITLQDIDRIRILLSDARNDVVKVLEVIDRFFATAELWDPKEIALFLAGNRDVEKLQNLAHRVREIN